MRTTVCLVLLTLSTAGAAAADGKPATRWTHARPLTPGASELLADATRRSAIVGFLLDALEGTDIVVYLSDRMSGLYDEPTAHLTFVTRCCGLRYVLVSINLGGVSPSEGIALLAHELHHALEVARAAEVQDSASLARLYGRIGWKCRRHQYETEQARLVGSRVWFELTGRTR